MTTKDAARLWAVIGEAAERDDHVRDWLGDSRDVDVVRGTGVPAELRHIYSASRTHLAGMGLDVSGLDALLANLEDRDEDFQLSVYRMTRDGKRALVFSDDDVPEVLGWVLLPERA